MSRESSMSGRDRNDDHDTGRALIERVGGYQDGGAAATELPS
jgi:hypothetical protein